MGFEQFGARTQEQNRLYPGERRLQEKKGSRARGFWRVFSL